MLRLVARLAAQAGVSEQSAEVPRLPIVGQVSVAAPVVGPSLCLEALSMKWVLWRV